MTCSLEAFFCCCCLRRNFFTRVSPPSLLTLLVLVFTRVCFPLFFSFLYPGVNPVTKQLCFTPWRDKNNRPVGFFHNSLTFVSDCRSFVFFQQHTSSHSFPLCAVPLLLCLDRPRCPRQQSSCLHFDVLCNSPPPPPIPAFLLTRHFF